MIALIDFILPDSRRQGGVGYRDQQSETKRRYNQQPALLNEILYFIHLRILFATKTRKHETV
jgi:hypothetical protein